MTGIEALTPPRPRSDDAEMVRQEARGRTVASHVKEAGQ